MMISKSTTTGNVTAAYRVDRAGCDGLEPSVVLEPVDEAPEDAHDGERPENPEFHSFRAAPFLHCAEQVNFKTIKSDSCIKDGTS